jgi:hypothetical protein
VSCGLVTIDTFGERVELDHSNWQRHLSYRPEIESIHPHLPPVLQDPDVVVQTSDGQRHFYRRGLVTGRFQHHYIRVIVGYHGSAWKIKTTWFQRTIDTERGTIICQRLTNLS